MTVIILKKKKIITYLVDASIDEDEDDVRSIWIDFWMKE